MSSNCPIPSPAIIRDATADDASQISELAASVFTLTFGHTVTPKQLAAFINETYSVKAITGDINNPKMSTVIASDTESGDVLGFAQLTRGTTDPCLADYDNTVEFQRIYLYPKAHGTGVVKLLSDDLLAKARKEGFKWIWLGVWEENFKGQRAYEKWGYKKIGKHDFVVGGDVQTDDIMIKPL